MNLADLNARLKAVNLRLTAVYEEPIVSIKYNEKEAMLIDFSVSMKHTIKDNRLAELFHQIRPILEDWRDSSV